MNRRHRVYKRTHSEWDQAEVLLDVPENVCANCPTTDASVIAGNCFHRGAFTLRWPSLFEKRWPFSAATGRCWWSARRLVVRQVGLISSWARWCCATLREVLLWACEARSQAVTFLCQAKEKHYLSQSNPVLLVPTVEMNSICKRFPVCVWYNAVTCLCLWTQWKVL